MNAGLDPALLARVEDAGLNASAPRQQRWLDGWLVRTCPGKAKRARCIQAVAAGREPVADKLARCGPIYAAANLRLYVRVTPFSQPDGLDDELAALGMERIDDTRVMVKPSLAGAVPVALPAGCRIEAADGAAFADWIGHERGSSDAERRAHAERTAQSPVPYIALLMRNGTGEVVAGGQVAVEGELAGLYDVFTAASARGRGHATTMCAALLQVATERGARTGYLQVDAANSAAIAVYRRLDFVDGYGYHYRTPPQVDGG